MLKPWMPKKHNSYILLPIWTFACSAWKASAARWHGYAASVGVDLTTEGASRAGNRRELGLCSFSSNSWIDTDDPGLTSSLTNLLPPPFLPTCFNLTFTFLFASTHAKCHNGYHRRQIASLPCMKSSSCDLLAAALRAKSWVLSFLSRPMPWSSSMFTKKIVAPIRGCRGASRHPLWMWHD